MPSPDPNYPYPFEKLPYELENLKRTAFLKHMITKKNIEIGDFTYFDDPNGIDKISRNIKYIIAANLDNLKNAK